VSDATRTTDAETAARIVELEGALAAERAALAAARARADAAEAERDRLREAYRNLQIEIELMRRRLFVAKAERVDTAQLELEFATKLAALDAVAGQLQSDEIASGPNEPADASGRCRRRKPTGRRDLSGLSLPEERIEISDPELEGKAERIGFEERRELRWRRGGFVSVVVARVKYRVDGSAPVGEAADPSPSAAGKAASPSSPDTARDDDAGSRIITAPMPPTLFERSMAAPSLVAHIASDKFCDGLPLHRQEDRFARLGVPLDRGTMCRWLEEAGATLGATIVEAMRQEALRTAFCIATDATGILVQPAPRGDRKRQPCRRAHFFVPIADADHVFFEYTPHETSAVVGEMFRGFSGYVQADAKSVYDILYRPPDARARAPDDDPDLGVRHEVGCWSHLRTKMWEAAIALGDVVAREGLARIMRMFQLERAWKDRPAVDKKALRDRHLRPHLDSFFEFVAAAYEREKNRRGLLRSALGYAVRQKEALLRFLDDGRLEMTNNRSERQLRRVAWGRKAWLFVGSDDHGQAAGNLLTLIASARLHGLDPEVYLRDVFRVLPHWPRERYLELAPRYWAITRARLDRDQLEQEVGWLTIPMPPLPTAAPPAPPPTNIPEIAP
jgi:hypothetical protein